MNPVSSSEDIKPPLGLNGVMKVPAHPSMSPLSLTKHICAICGDRSSGEDKVSECEGVQNWISQSEIFNQASTHTIHKHTGIRVAQPITVKKNKKNKVCINNTRK